MPQKSGTEASLKDVGFIDEKSGWAVGEKRTILHTEEQGWEWKRQESGTDVTLNGVDFADNDNGWAVGDKGVILKNYAPETTPTPTPSPTATATPPTPTPTFTPTPSPTNTPSPTPTPTFTPTQTPTPTATPTPTTPPSFSVRINFQPAGSGIPEGYVMDDGSPYGSHGGSGGGELEDPLEYGWRSP